MALEKPEICQYKCGGNISMQGSNSEFQKVQEKLSAPAGQPVVACCL